MNSYNGCFDILCGCITYLEEAAVGKERINSGAKQEVER